MPMGEIDTQFLKLYEDEPLFLSEVVQNDAELLMLDTWLMETFRKWKVKSLRLLESENWKLRTEKCGVCDAYL